MKRFIKNLRGVSPVVGALMLTLIAVVAATSFAVFISAQQAKYEGQKNLEQRIELESLDILSIQPEYDASDELEKLTFLMTNKHTDHSDIENILINNKFVQNIRILPDNDYSLNEDYIFDLKLDTTQSWEIEIETDSTNIYNYEPIAFNEPITIRIQTDLGNNFEETFYSPMAVINMELEQFPTASGYTTQIVLDGSKSEALTEDSYIVKWLWDVEQTSPTTATILTQEPGKKINIPPLTAGNTYDIFLTVEDNYGMIGKAEVEHTH